jgi:hypothetical protein
MSTSPARGGSSVSARSVTPSLNLAELVSQLGKSISSTSSAGQAALPLLSVEKGRVTVQTRGVLHRLFKDEAFSKAFTPVDGAGLIRDTTVPPRGTIARIGGRLLAGTEGSTAKALDKLHDDISALVDSALADIDVASLTLPSMDAALDAFAASLVGERKPELPGSASMVPIVFAANDRRAEERAKDVGRVLTAIETVDGSDWLELLLQGIARKMRNDGLDDEIEGTLATIRSQRKLPGSQIRAFLDFLDDQALARVRLQVTMRLMSALALQSNRPGFKAYVERVVECYERFGGVDGEALLLDPSKVYGGNNTSDLAEHLRKSLFYTCLPAWAHGSAQLFETRTEPTQGFATVREVSYRFRVNGNNPQTGKSAFDSRLERRFEDVLSAPGPDAFVRRDIAEWVFLHLVIPDSLVNPTPVDIRAEGERVAAALKNDPVGALRKLHTSLAARSKVVGDIADELIELLKSRVNRVVSIANGTVDKFVVSLHRDIVDWDAIDTITSKTDILRKSEMGDDSIEWFKYLTVSVNPSVKGIASYGVKTQLKERSLAVAGPARPMAMSRDLSVRVLPVRFVPYKWSKEDGACLADVPNTKYFDAGAGIEVQYALDMLTMRKQKDEKENEKREQFRAGSYVAFTLLTYVTLWELQRRVRAAHPETAMTMVRLAHTGKQQSAEDDANDPNTAVYAISQALEKALAREGAIKLQGVTTSPGTNPSSLQWKRRGALHALLGGQRLKFELEGELDKVALVTYVTRPCDEHPAHADADGYLFMSRTYVAERGEGGAVLRCLNMRSRVVDSRKDFKDPKPILEEIARLKNDGFQHVMLLSHHFGNRHIGRAAERHAPHGTLEFLDEAVKSFPEMRLYPLRRDVFPATRMHKRASSESGFEVLSFKDHQEMYEATSADALRSILPVYTFATLAVVGQDDERPQSGFCTYFYDAEQRISDIEVAKLTEQNILGLGGRDGIRKSLVSVLRAIHFMESEKPASKVVQLPVLDPYGWVAPVKRSTAGELPVMTRRGGRTVLLSLPAVLAHVTKVLHKEEAAWKK